MTSAKTIRTARGRSNGQRCGVTKACGSSLVFVSSRRPGRGPAPRAQCFITAKETGESPRTPRVRRPFNVRRRAGRWVQEASSDRDRLDGYRARRRTPRRRGRGPQPGFRDDGRAEVGRANVAAEGRDRPDAPPSFRSVTAGAQDVGKPIAEHQAISSSSGHSATKSPRPPRTLGLRPEGRRRALRLEAAHGEAVASRPAGSGSRVSGSRWLRDSKEYEIERLYSDRALLPIGEGGPRKSSDWYGGRSCSAAQDCIAALAAYTHAQWHRATEDLIETAVTRFLAEFRRSSR